MNEPTSIELDELSYSLVQTEIEGRQLLSHREIDWQRLALALEHTLVVVRTATDAELRKMRQQRDTWAVAAVVLAGVVAMLTVLVIALWRMA